MIKNTCTDFIRGNFCDQTSYDGKKEDGNPKNGLVHTYNEDGSLSASINYKNNLRHGLALDYYKMGSCVLKIMLMDSNKACK